MGVPALAAGIVVTGGMLVGVLRWLLQLVDFVVELVLAGITVFQVLVDRVLQALGALVLALWGMVQTASRAVRQAVMRRVDGLVAPAQPPSVSLPTNGTTPVANPPQPSGSHP